MHSEFAYQEMSYSAFVVCYYYYCTHNGFPCIAQEVKFRSRFSALLLAYSLSALPNWDVSILFNLVVVEEHAKNQCGVVAQEEG